MTADFTNRPTFSGPAPIPWSQVTHYLWGEPEAGEVSDWIYVSSEKIHQMVWGLPPGGSFRHSEQTRTLFNADEIYYVLEGTMVLCNPETGEVHPITTGEAAFFRKDTWHHAFNIGTGQLRVLEFMAPPPRQGTTQAYAQTKPYLTSSRYTQDEWLGQWPMGARDARAAHTMRAIDRRDIAWRLEGDGHPVLVGLLASTEHLTVGQMRLLPGQRSQIEVHSGDEGLYVLAGQLNVHLPGGSGPNWYQLAPRDGFYLPEGTKHQYANYTDQPVEFLFGVAPGYLADDDAGIARLRAATTDGGAP